MCLVSSAFAIVMTFAMFVVVMCQFAVALRWCIAPSVEVAWMHVADCWSRWLLRTVVLLQSLTCVVELMLTVLVDVE